MESRWVTWGKLEDWEVLNAGLLDRGRSLLTWLCLVLMTGRCLCWLFKGIVRSLWNATLRFDILQFKLNSHSHCVPLVS